MYDYELTEEFEPTSPLPRWLTALNMDMLFLVSTAENVKESHPDEYHLYQHLGIKSVKLQKKLPHFVKLR